MSDIIIHVPNIHAESCLYMHKRRQRRKEKAQWMWRGREWHEMEGVEGGAPVALLSCLEELLSIIYKALTFQRD